MGAGFSGAGEGAEKSMGIKPSARSPRSASAASAFASCSRTNTVTWPLKIGAAQIALSDKGSAIVPGSGKPLTFGGRASIVIPPGAPAISDPVELSVAPLSSVVVSFFLPDVTPVNTFHWDAVQTTYVVAGNKVAETTSRPTPRSPPGSL